MSQCVGVVLAGGAGRRLGRRKGELVTDGKSWAERAAAELWPVCGSVLISLAPGAPSPAPAHPSLLDPEPAGRGPLVGIRAAFEATGDADLVVLACDYPNVDRTLLSALVERESAGIDLVMLSDYAGRDHPLVARWCRSAADAVKAAVDQGRLKVRGLFADLRVLRLGPSDLPGVDLDRALLNVNAPEQLARLADAPAAAIDGEEPQ